MLRSKHGLGTEFLVKRIEILCAPVHIHELHAPSVCLTGLILIIGKIRTTILLLTTTFDLLLCLPVKAMFAAESHFIFICSALL
jgi:hypothetical protein